MPNKAMTQTTPSSPSSCPSCSKVSTTTSRPPSLTPRVPKSTSSPRKPANLPSVNERNSLTPLLPHLHQTLLKKRNSHLRPRRTQNCHCRPHHSPHGCLDVRRLVQLRVSICRHNRVSDLLIRDYRCVPLIFRQARAGIYPCNSCQVSPSAAAPESRPGPALGDMVVGT